MNAVLIDKPNEHDIEAVRPHLRKHMKPFVFQIKGGEVTVQGKNFHDAKKRFKAMTGYEVAFIPANSKKVKH